MNYQAIFRRYELKYLLTPYQKERILQVMQGRMCLDEYGHTTIRNIYFDTDTYRLVRRSLEKPAYKEKLRIRSYRKAEAGDDVFVELKKKYNSVVYKRRLAIPEWQAMECFQTGKALPVHSQIAEEIEYFRKYYQPLFPTVFLSYERDAYYDTEGSDFRVTFDNTILYRDREFSLASDISGTPLLKPEETLMEIKTSGAIPLWFSHVMTELKLSRTSFSKYGYAYLDMMTKGGRQYA